MRYLHYIIITSLLLGACAPLVPANTPPQLEHTPGAYVIVTEETFDAGVFRVDYPQSWRVVKTSIAAVDTIEVVFVAPDDSTITLTQVEQTGDPANEDEHYITLANDILVHVVVDLSDSADETIADATRQLIASIRPA